MITDRIFTPGLAQVAYMVADEEAGVAAIIDPRRDVDEYVTWAEERGLRYVAILETHVHADFVSGMVDLVAERRQGPDAVELAERGAARLEERLRRDHQDAHSLLIFARIHSKVGLRHLLHV